MVGLQNLINSCYMNSVLQCLSHSLPFAAHFLSYRFVADLNIANKLGCSGQMAALYAELLRWMWRGTDTAITPRKFKAVVSKYLVDFANTQQHDAEEFLSSLLDHLVCFSLVLSYRSLPLPSPLQHCSARRH
jgi:ubiquitin C-terminal hydrolase